VLIEAGKPAEAEGVIREALSIGQAALPLDHRSHGTRKVRLARVLVAQQKFDEAEKLLLDLANGVDSGSSAPASVRKGAAEQLIELYERSGRSDEARVWRGRIGASS
jgi:predicted negative regulator of RcsB-dependent stress response